MKGRPLPRILVAGGGITGLAAAYQVHCLRPDAQLLLAEPRQRLGGNIQTENRDGFLLDGGPDSFLSTKPAAAELCRELGLADQLITPEPGASLVYVAKRGNLVPLPAGMVLAVPTRLGPMLRTPLLPWFAKLRILGDLLVSPDTEHNADETVAAFLLRHFGRTATDDLAGPLLAGIFAGDIDELSIGATFPQLVEIERRHGSLIRGWFFREQTRMRSAEHHRQTESSAAGDLAMLWGFWRWIRREAGVGASPFLSLGRGMGSLVEALVQRIPPSCLRLGTAVERLVPTQDSAWRAFLSDGTNAEFDSIILSTPAHVAARLVPDRVLAETLAEIPYVSTATVFFAFDPPSVSRDLVGAGFFVPRREGQLLACTWISSKWAGRAPQGKILVRAFLGGARDPERVKQAGEQELAALAHRELSRLMGPLGEPRFERVFRWIDSNPQPVVGHLGRMDRIAAQLRGQPRLHLAGSAYGVGISDCIRQGRAAARAALGLT